AQPGDLLPGRLKVMKRLGRGACAVALLVERGGQEYVLKAALAPEHNERLRGEAEVLQKLRHQRVVQFIEAVEVGNHAGFLTQPVLVGEKQVETLGHRLR